MSGHSKWAQIKRQKGVNDQKRGQTFTKLSNAITLAVKQGGGISDPDQNFRLRLAIDSARASNMPKENIERAILRAGGKEGGELSEVLYEGFGPAGTAIMVEAATDNTMRTSSQIKNVFEKNGGKFGQPGSVSYLFKQVGQISVSKQNKTYEEIFEACVSSGADDIEDGVDEVLVYTKVSDLSKIKSDLVGLGFEILDAGIYRKPNTLLEINDDSQVELIAKFVDTLSSLDDVQQVFTNIS